MKNLNLCKLNDNLRKATEIVLPELGIGICDCGAVITAKEADRLTVKKTSDGYEIGYSKLSEFCRYEIWEKWDDTHTVVRFVTSFATTEAEETENVDSE